MFGKKADDKIAKKQAEQEAKDKAAMEKFGVDFDSYTSDDIKEKNVASHPPKAAAIALPTTPTAVQIPSFMSYPP